LATKLREADEVGWQKGSPASWSEHAIRLMDEAHALGAIGSPAVASLVGLLDSCSEWGRINAAFALGEMDAQASEAVPALMRRLDDDSHRVVRTVLDALGAIGGVEDQLITRVGRFLVDSRSAWDQPSEERPNWLPRDQVRVNATIALARLVDGVSIVEDELIQALDDPCGYVGLLATDALQHTESSTAQQAVLDLVMAQRWDPSLDEIRAY
jgi:HEAT repeat protein